MAFGSVKVVVVCWNTLDLPINLLERTERNRGKQLRRGDFPGMFGVNLTQFTT